MTQTIISNRYEVLEKLGAGGMGTVWLARDKLRGENVALKQVLMSTDEQRLAITREFRALSTLRHPNIVSVIEYGFHDNQPYFTMEYLPDAAPFDKTSAHPIEHTVQMLHALGYLHRRGILHRDLKPGNVMVTADGLVKVLDFGLALDTVRDKSGETGGTLRYMSPETLLEEPPAPGSDLWAVGVMLCEMLTGHHPFDTSDPVRMVVSVLQESPNLNGMDEEIAEVVARLLAKDLNTRYASAMEVIHDLSRAAHIELPPESQAHRESFLQAAAFVGRDEEYAALENALRETAAGNRQFWLIGGEAGAGKSRLLDEVRTRALVDGFVVLQGQGVEGGGLPYQLWRNPARKLVLGAPMPDLTASILKDLVPDIATLLERDVADVPALEPKPHRDRLAAALLERARALPAPVLVILEDCHWAEDGLELLKVLLPQLNAMIVGTYRSDEKPALPDSFPTARRMMMERLTPEAVAALSASMIGAENATPELVERLARETEGNALFMVEVMRALAEEAGSLHDISHHSFPATILAGGMVAVLRRRVERVPAWALETLKLAAIIGRVINLPVLRAAGIQHIERWLQACADAAVLEPYHGEWRFSHDRLREVLLKDRGEMAALHERAALAIEAVYPADVHYAEALAEHWRFAGNAEREVHYILKAAEYLVKISADYARAETLLQRGLDLNQPRTRAELLLWSGNAAENQSQYGEAETFYQNALDAEPTPHIRASILNRLGTICWRQGKYAEAGEYARQAQTIAEAQNDPHNIATSLNVQGNVMTYQGDYVTARAHLERGLRIRREIGDRQGTASSLNNLGIIAARQGDNATARSYFEDSLRTRRDMGDQQGMSDSLNNLGIVTGRQGDYDAAHAYYTESLRIGRSIGDRQGTAVSLSNLGIIAGRQGDYAASRAYYEESLRIRREINDRRGTAAALLNLGDAAFRLNDVDTARAAYEESLTLCQEIGVRDVAVHAATGWVILLIHLKDCDTARVILVGALQTAREIDVVPAMLFALMGAAHWIADVERAAAWIGLMLAQGSASLTDEWSFKQLVESVRAALGVENYDAAVERGKSLDIRAEVDALLAEMNSK